MSTSTRTNVSPVPEASAPVARLLLALTFVFLSAAQHLSAQEIPVLFDRISIEQGLSQSIVESMVQDRRGFMWFCTEEGLNRYDGYGFKVLRSIPGNPNSLSHDQTTVVTESRSGMLWIGTYNGGLNMYDTRTDTFAHFRHDPHDSQSLSHDVVWSICAGSDSSIWVGTQYGLDRLTLRGAAGSSAGTFLQIYHDPLNPSSLTNNTVRAIFEDREGTLWVGTDDGLNRLVRSGRGEVPAFVRYRNTPGDNTSISNNVIRTIYQDRGGTLWVGTDGGLNKLVRKASGDGRYEETFVSYRHNPGDPRSLGSDQVYALYEDGTGAFWVGTNGTGLDRFDRARGEFTHYRYRQDDPRSLSYDEIRCLYEDRSGNLWVGTYGGGASKLDRARKAFAHYLPDPRNPDGLSAAIIWCFYEDNDGSLWIGTHGGGLDRFDRKLNRYTHYRSIPGNPHSLSNNVVRQLIVDRTGTYWIGTDGGGVNTFDLKSGQFTRYLHDPRDPKSLSHNEIRSLMEDRTGAIWVGTRGGGITKIVPGRTPVFKVFRNDPDNEGSLSNDYVRQVYQDRSGTIWVATYGGGLERFDSAKGTFAHYRTDPKEPTSLSSDYVFCLHEDARGILWLATWGGGLNRFDPASNQFTRFTEKDGLPSNAIYGILEDNQGYLWLSTVNGLSRFDPRSRTFRNFTERDGLQSKEFNGGAYYKSRSGELFFGGINGFNAFYPERIRDNQHVPPIVITSFSKLNEEVSFDRPIEEMKELKLSYRDYVFTFEFAALDFTAPEKNRYAYKMEGLDNDWIPTSAGKRFAHYTTLPPGSYVFKVKGSNNDGIWNEAGAAIRVAISPPFWNTWWFAGVLVLSVSGLGFVFYKRRLGTVRMKAELLAAHDAQMSIMPHADPQVSGLDISGVCIPANEVGGDFFDYLWLDENTQRIGIVVGDVSGKAMKAAMTAVMSCGMIQSSGRDHRRVGEILTAVNYPLFAATAKDVFIAACLASVDVRMKEFTFTNAGLIKPLLKTSQGASYVEVSGPTHPLGILRNHEYGERRIQLGKGDVVVLVTDGVPEAQNRNREFYGDERLKNLLSSMETGVLSARQIKESIIRDVQRYSGSSVQHDDMTIVVVKVA